MAFRKPNTTVERNAVRFVLQLMENFGYRRTVSTSLRDLERQMNEAGCPISIPTIRTYWKVLERMNLVKCDKRARFFGFVYHFNIYAINQLRETTTAKAVL